MTNASLYPAWAIVREARARAGLTQAQLAALAGTSQSAVAAYERARRLPDISTLSRLVEACGFELGLTLEEPDRQRGASQSAARRRTVEDRIRTNTAAVRMATELRRSRE